MSGLNPGSEQEESTSRATCCLRAQCGALTGSIFSISWSLPSILAAPADSHHHPEPGKHSVCLRARRACTRGRDSPAVVQQSRAKSPHQPRSPPPRSAWGQNPGGFPAPTSATFQKRLQRAPVKLGRSMGPGRSRLELLEQIALEINSNLSGIKKAINCPLKTPN